MKLLLTSYGTVNPKVSEELVRLVGKKPSETKVLFIITASKHSENIDYMNKQWASLDQTGFSIEKYDIEDKPLEDIQNHVDMSDVIFVLGGNPFYLLRAVRNSGFDKIMKTLGENKIYMGASAGTYLVCPTVEMGLWKKPKRDTFGMTDFTGLKLVNFLVFAHYKDEFKTLIDDKARQTKFEIYSITDDQAISIENGKTRFINF